MIKHLTVDIYSLVSEAQTPTPHALKVLLRSCVGVGLHPPGSRESDSRTTERKSVNHIRLFRTKEKDPGETLVSQVRERIIRVDSLCGACRKQVLLFHTTTFTWVFTCTCDPSSERAGLPTRELTLLLCSSARSRFRILVGKLQPSLLGGKLTVMQMLERCSTQHLWQKQEFQDKPDHPTNSLMHFNTTSLQRRRN